MSTDAEAFGTEKTVSRSKRTVHRPRRGKARKKPTIGLLLAVKIECNDARKNAG